MFRIAGFPEPPRPEPEAPPGTAGVTLRRAFALVDEVVTEVYSMTARFPPDERGRLGSDLRAHAKEASLALLASPGRPRISQALESLIALRYLLSIGRRMGHVDIRKYRGLCAREDKAAEALRALGQLRVRGESTGGGGGD